MEEGDIDYSSNNIDWSNDNEVAIEIKASDNLEGSDIDNKLENINERKHIDSKMEGNTAIRDSFFMSEDENEEVETDRSVDEEEIDDIKINESKSNDRTAKKQPVFNYVLENLMIMLSFALIISLIILSVMLIKITNLLNELKAIQQGKLGCTVPTKAQTILTKFKLLLIN